MVSFCLAERFLPPEGFGVRGRGFPLRRCGIVLTGRTPRAVACSLDVEARSGGRRGQAPRQKGTVADMWSSEVSQRSWRFQHVFSDFSWMFRLFIRPKIASEAVPHVGENRRLWRLNTGRKPKEGRT